MHAWSHTSNAYVSMPCHECMGTGGHKITPPTGGLPCAQGPMCSHTHLRHGRAHAQAVVLRRSHVCPCNPGQHGTGWAWTRVHCPGHAHADMAQPVAGPAGFVQMCAWPQLGSYLGSMKHESEPQLLMLAKCGVSNSSPHSCTTRLAVSDTGRVGHACRASSCEAAAVSVQPDTAAIATFPLKP